MLIYDRLSDCRIGRKWLSAILVLGLSPMASGSELPSIEIELQQETYQIELATTPEQRRLGLMHRQQLDSKRGMLLVYPRSGDHRVWMKNVLIPLRVYWIDSQFRVIHSQRLEPCNSSPCPTYGSPAPSRYILELSDHEHALKPGQLIEAFRDL